MIVRTPAVGCLLAYKKKEEEEKKTQWKKKDNIGYQWVKAESQ
jgi:hypothetical protein